MKIISQFNFLALITGIFVTMPIATIGAYDYSISVFSALFSVWLIIILLLALKSNSNIPINIRSISFMLFLMSSLLSSIVGILYFSGKQEWIDTIYSYLNKTLIFIFFLICVIRISNSNQMMSHFMRGFLLGCIMNLIWSIIEGIYFYLFNGTLNDILFAGYLSRLPDDRQYMTIIANDIIRASGFNTDPAHLGVLIPIVALYAIFNKNYFLLLISFVSLIFSGSTTAAIVTAISLILSPFSKLDIQFNLRKILGVLVVLSIMIAITMMSETAREGIYNNAMGFYKRVFETYVTAEDKGPRYVYHAYFLDAINHNGALVLTGTGFGTASYPYVGNPIISHLLTEGYTPYDPESTYISYFFDTGIFGVLMYLVALLTLIINFRKRISNNKESLLIYCSLSAIFFAGLFYHYTLTAYQVIIICIAIGLSSKVQSRSISSIP